MDKQQILVVDDEEINRIILMQMFEDSLDEYELLEAGNGLEAVEQIDRNQNIVLILLDVVMPIMDGFKVLEHMQEKRLLEAIPVILGPLWRSPAPLSAAPCCACSGTAL